MNKEIIKKYKTEFDAWINGEEVEYRLAHNGGNWFDLMAGSDLAWQGNTVYRIKPTTRMIGYDICPLPITSLDGLTENDIVYCSVAIAGELYQGMSYKDNKDFIAANLDKGLFFTSPEEANNTSVALLKLTSVEVDLKSEVVQKEIEEKYPTPPKKGQPTKIKSEYNGVSGYKAIRGDVYVSEIMINKVKHYSKPLSGRNAEWFAATTYDKFIIKYDGNRKRLNFPITDYDVEKIKANESI